MQILMKTDPKVLLQADKYLAIGALPFSSLFKAFYPNSSIFQGLKKNKTIQAQSKISRPDGKPAETMHGFAH